MSCRSPIVVFEDVAVSYTPGRPPALAGIDLVVEHGELPENQAIIVVQMAKTHNVLFGGTENLSQSR